MFDLQKPPEWQIVRDKHPLRPFLVLHNEQPVARFAEEWDVREYVGLRQYARRGVP
jgi:hypothetical protein